MLCPNTDFLENTPTSEVLDRAGMPSVHQQAAILTIRLALRILRTGKPSYLAARFVHNPQRRRRKGTLVVPRLRLNVSHEGFLSQAIHLVNKLPTEIVEESSVTKQKRLVREWALVNIQVKP